MARSDAHRGPEMLESEATGKLKSLFDDIKITFRVPIVDLVWRDLAAHPDFLELAWQQLHPNARTLFFEQAADDIRSRAVSGVSKLGAPPRPNPEASEALRVFHYLNAKLLLAMASIRTATGGSHPALLSLPAHQKRQIVAGVPKEAPSIAEVDPQTADEHVASIFTDMQDILGQPTVTSDFRVLATWPEYLGWAWQSTKSVIPSEEYRGLQRELRRAAEENLASLPFRIDLSPHTMRLCGMTEGDIDDVRATLDRYYGLLPGRVANIAYLATGAYGQYGAEKSPFPARLA